MKKDLQSLFDDFARQAENAEGRSVKTVANYRQNFELLKTFKPKIQVKDLTSATMSDFFFYLNTRPRKVGTKMIVRKLQGSSLATVRGKLSSFFVWLKDNGHLRENPFDKIAYPDVSYTKREAFTRDELDKLYLAVSRDILWDNPFQKKRNLTMVMFLTLTGVRKEELLGLLLSDLDMKNRILTIRPEISKSKRYRTIPVSKELADYLAEYLEARKSYTTPCLWVSSTSDSGFTEHGAKHLKKQLDKATGLNCHLHRFRHTFAVNYYMATKDLLHLSRLMGHRDASVTLKIYLRWLPDEKLLSELDAMRVALFR